MDERRNYGLFLLHNNNDNDELNGFLRWAIVCGTHTNTNAHTHFDFRKDSTEHLTIFRRCRLLTQTKKKVLWANFFAIVCPVVVRKMEFNCNAGCRVKICVHEIVCERLVCSRELDVKKFSRLDCLMLEMENNFKLGANSLQVILLYLST